MSFNAYKTKCMIVTPNKSRSFSSPLDACDFGTDNKPIEFFSSFSHLGHLITSSLSDDEDIVKRRGEFIGQDNNVICYFRKLSSSVRYKLFRSYCTSFYGCELWLLDNRSIDYLCIAWRKGLPKIWNISPRTHCGLLPLLCVFLWPTRFVIVFLNLHAHVYFTIHILSAPWRFTVFTMLEESFILYASICFRV
jgi:hypothetical protein